MNLVFKGGTLKESVNLFNAVNQLSTILLRRKNDISAAMIGFFINMAIRYKIQYKYIVYFDYKADTDSFFLSKKIPVQGEENNPNHYWASPERMPSQSFDEEYTEGMNAIQIEEAIALKEEQKTWITFPLPEWWEVTPQAIKEEFLTFINAELLE